MNSHAARAAYLHAVGSSVEEIAAELAADMKRPQPLRADEVHGLIVRGLEQRAPASGPTPVVAFERELVKQLEAGAFVREAVRGACWAAARWAMEHDDENPGDVLALVAGGCVVHGDGTYTATAGGGGESTTSQGLTEEERWHLEALNKLVKAAADDVRHATGAVDEDDAKGG